MSSTRSIHLAAGVFPEQARNEGTVVGVRLSDLRLLDAEAKAFDVEPEAPAGFEELFRANVDAIATAHARHVATPGVLVAAVVPGAGVRGTCWLEAGKTMRSAIIGRHEHADLHLTGDPSLSLRHLAVLVRRDEESASGVRVRAIDLRSGLRFRDEAGRALSSVSANGPLFLRASAFRLFLLPTGNGHVIPSDPDQAWELLAPRVFADARADEAEPTDAARPDRREGGAGLRREVPEVTVVTAEPAPVAEFVSLLGDGEAPIGHLHVRTAGAWGRDAVVSLGAGAARRGVLLGRYDRCDGVFPAGALSDAVSRVHALFLLEAGRLHVVDAGSTNGTEHRGKRVRCHPLAPGDRIDLPAAALWWHPAE